MVFANTGSPLNFCFKDTRQQVLTGWNFDGLRAGILTGFVNTALLATLHESKSAIFASATPTAAPPCRLFSVSDHALATHACKGVRAIFGTS
jgi:hypothetical protein